MTESLNFRPEFFFRIRISSNERMRNFAAVLNLLRAVGKDLILEIENALIFRALNEAKTSFASVELTSNFFEAFEVYGSSYFTCKVPLRPLCAICKSSRGLQMTQIHAERTAEGENLLVVDLVGINGVRRTHSFPFSDCEIISATFDDEGVSSLRADSKIFGQLLEHLYKSPEIAIEATKESFKLRSYHGQSDVDESKKFLETGLSVDIHEFDSYDWHLPPRFASVNAAAETAIITSPPSVILIFCSRELRALLVLCDAANVGEVSLFYSDTGLPIKLNCSHDDFTVNLIMTTMHRAVGFGSATFTSSSQQARCMPDGQPSSSTQSTHIAKRRKIVDKDGPCREHDDP